MLSVKISEVKQEYQLQQWSGMLRERQESGLSVKDWCQEQGISEHSYYYRLRRLRQMACSALEKVQPLQLAEVPLAPKQEDCQARLRLTTKAGTLEILDTDRSTLDQVLQAMLHAE